MPPKSTSEPPPAPKPATRTNSRFGATQSPVADNTVGVTTGTDANIPPPLVADTNTNVGNVAINNSKDEKLEESTSTSSSSSSSSSPGDVGSARGEEPAATNKPGMHMDALAALQLQMVKMEERHEQQMKQQAEEIVVPDQLRCYQRVIMQSLSGCFVLQTFKVKKRLNSGVSWSLF